MTTRSGDGATEDQYWRPPAETFGDGAVGQDVPAQRPAEGKSAPVYAGPPASVAPPPGWRPPTFVQLPPPRRLPPQDLDRLNAEERDARVLTQGVGMVAAAVLIIVMLLLCARGLS